MRNFRIGGIPAPALFALTVSLSLFLLTPSVRAAADEKGSVTGTVTDQAGKPVVGLALRLEQDQPIDARGGGKPGSTKIVARVTTDQQGKFTMPNIPAGGYRLVAGSQNVGWIYLDVTVTAGKETNLGELKLAKTG